MNKEKEALIAPCGMNCSLCIAYQFKEKDLNKRGFHKKYCPGCLPRGKTASIWEMFASFLERERSGSVLSVKIIRARD